MSKNFQIYPGCDSTILPEVKCCISIAKAFDPVPLYILHNTKKVSSQWDDGCDTRGKGNKSECVSLLHKGSFLTGGLKESLAFVGKYRYPVHIVG